MFWIEAQWTRHRPIAEAPIPQSSPWDMEGATTEQRSQAVAEASGGNSLRRVEMCHGRHTTPPLMLLLFGPLI